jgi:signal transduction histidine kinase
LARTYSLKRRLIGRLMAFQAAVVLFIVAGLFVTGFLFNTRSVESTIEILREAVARDAAGRLVLRSTPDLAGMRQEIPDLWFVIRDRQGQELVEGVVPAEYRRFGDSLDQIGQARFGWTIFDPPGPTARMRRVDGAAGSVQILTGSDARLRPSLVMLGVSLVLLKEVLPVLAVMAAAALIVTPLVVRRALAGLDRAAAEARTIEIDQRGVRLPRDGVPDEVAPLVEAVNAALGRLDRGYDRHKRFLAAASHELRTPIAILNTRIAALPPGPEKTHLLEDAIRLSTLTEQLLDLERFERRPVRFEPVDLVAVGQRVVVDLAPLAFAAGYQMAFEPEGEAVMVEGDRMSIERALTNLVQNAIEHGGRSGTITVAVAEAGTIDVTDEGRGIPEEARERVFEPFQRLQRRGRGIGLGLNLVRDIMRLHGGEVVVRDTPSGGACLRMIFPKAPEAAASA